jgi:2-polyprenyl-3-methyl-5-hydroxy-6-metoxy-1,4-benzoquinol methylase
MMAGPLAGDFDGVYAVEVIEHIRAEQEDRFVGNLAATLGRHGACLIGTPTLESQVYASPPSKAGHVNCKDAPGLRALMLRRFHQVFMFS